MTALVKKTRVGLSRTADTVKRTEYLAFRLVGDMYAVRISIVAEIVRPPPVTEVPRAPHATIGVVSVRGRLVTLIDLRKLFGMPGADLGSKRKEALSGRIGAPSSSGDLDTTSRVLLVDVGGDELVGLLVDAVLQVYRLSEAEIEPANVLGGDQPAHILGIGRPQRVQGRVARGDADILILVDLRTALEGHK